MSILPLASIDAQSINSRRFWTSSAHQVARWVSILTTEMSPAVSVWSWFNRRCFNSGQVFFRKGCSANVFRAPDVIREGGVGGCLHIICRCPATEGPGNRVEKAQGRGSLRRRLSPLLLAALRGDSSSMTGATYQGTLRRRRSAQGHKSVEEGSLSLLEWYDGG